MTELIRGSRIEEHIVLLAYLRFTLVFLIEQIVVDGPDGVAAPLRIRSPIG